MRKSSEFRGHIISLFSLLSIAYASYEIFYLSVVRLGCTGRTDTNLSNDNIHNLVICCVIYRGIEVHSHHGLLSNHSLIRFYSQSGIKCPLCDVTVRAC